MSSIYREQLEKYLSTIDVDCNSVLDIGGGQLHIKDRVNYWNVKNYKILDNDSQYSPDYFFNLNIDWGSIRGLPKNHNVIFCLEVFEYIYDPVTAHKNISHSLADDGIAYISYPTIYPLHNPPGIDYLRYTKNAIEKYLTLADFRTWEITPRMASDGMNALSDFWSRERMRPMKQTIEVYDIGYMVKAFK